jgi:hypothetical protein
MLKKNNVTQSLLVKCFFFLNQGVHFKSIPEKSEQVSAKTRNLIYESISVNSNYTSRIEVIYSSFCLFNKLKKI